MRRLNITLDDETDNLLAKHINQAKVIRDSVRMYHGGITTDTLQGMRAAFLKLSQQQDDLMERFVEQYEMVEKLYTMIEELKNR